MSFWCPHRICMMPSPGPCEWSDCKCLTATEKLERLLREKPKSPEPTADEMEEWDHERRQKLARDLEY